MTDQPCPRCGSPHVIRKHCPDGFGLKCPIGRTECETAGYCRSCDKQWSERCGRHALVLGA